MSLEVSKAGFVHSLHLVKHPCANEASLPGCRSSINPSKTWAVAIKLAGTWGFKSGNSLPATARNHLRRSQLLSAVDSTKISQNHCTFIGEALPRLVLIQNDSGLPQGLAHLPPAGS
jgi:hypothetical protein